MGLHLLVCTLKFVRDLTKRPQRYVWQSGGGAIYCVVSCRFRSFSPPLHGPGNWWTLQNFVKKEQVSPCLMENASTNVHSVLTFHAVQMGGGVKKCYCVKTPG